MRPIADPRKERYVGQYLDREQRIRRLRKTVDEACEKIKAGRLTLGEARKEAALVRLKAQELIPSEMDKFDLIYGARLKRMIEQFLLPKLKDESSK